jgi:membrane protein required for colicin V production
MNTVDLAVLGIIGFSALLAFARGFVREAFSLGTWIGAGLITIYGFAQARSIARDLIASPAVADGAAGVGLFLVSLIVLSVIASAISGRVRQSSLSALDRTLGLVFGLLRGLVLSCLLYMAFAWAVPEANWPEWAAGARTRPFLVSGSDFLKSLVPGQARERGAAAAIEAQKLLERERDAAAERAIRALVTPGGGGTAEHKAASVPKQPLPAGAAAAPAQPAAAGANSGYRQTERKEMDRLFQSAQ